MNQLNCVFALAICCGLVSKTSGQIYRWDTGNLIPDTETISLQPASFGSPGVRLNEFNEANALNRDLQFADFSGGLDLRGSSFYESWLEDAQFARANLERASFYRAKLDRADFSDANLRGAWLDSSSLKDANFRNTIIQGVSFIGTKVTEDQLYSTASYANGNLNGIEFNGFDLTGWSFAGKDLSSAKFWEGNLGEADFTDAKISYAWFYSPLTVEQLRSTASYREKDMRGVGFIAIDLREFDLSGQDLSDAYFEGRNLEGTSFSNAAIDGTRFYETGISQDQFYSTASYKDGNLRRISLSLEDLSGWNLSGKDLTESEVFLGSYRDADFSQSTLHSAWIRDSDFTNASFRNTDLSSAGFGRVTLDGSDFSGANINGVRFVGTALTKEQLYSTQSYLDRELLAVDFDGTTDMNAWDFSGQNLDGTRFIGTRLKDADFSNANIRNVNFGNTTGRGFSIQQLHSTVSYLEGDLSGVKFYNDDLRGWRLVDVNLSNASFSNSNLTDADLSRSRLIGVGFSGATLVGTNLADADISSASLRGVTSSGFTPEQFYATASYQSGDLGALDLSKNDLSNWNLANKRLRLVNLSEASLIGADLRGSDLTRANLTDASLLGADLRDSDLTGATLRGAEFAGTKLDHTILSLADLRGAHGLAFESTTTVRNVILPDSSIRGIDLRTSESLQIDLIKVSIDDLVARFARQPIRISDSFSMAPGSELAMEILIDNDVVGGFRQPAIVVDQDVIPLLAGKLRVQGLLIEPVLGSILDIFDWNEQPLLDSRFDSIEFPAGTLWDTSDLYTTGQVRLISIGESGDFDVNHELDAADINRLSDAVRASLDPRLDSYVYDLSHNGVIDQADRRIWVEDLASTKFGDANLDGHVDFVDFLSLSGGFGQVGGWAEGDFDGSGDVQFTDFLLLSGNFSKSVAAVPAVPEPSNAVLVLLGVGGIAMRRRR